VGRCICPESQSKIRKCSNYHWNPLRFWYPCWTNPSRNRGGCWFKRVNCIIGIGHEIGYRTGFYLQNLLRTQIDSTSLMKQFETLRSLVVSFLFRLPMKGNVPPYVWFLTSKKFPFPWLCLFRYFLSTWPFRGLFKDYLSIFWRPPFA